jgi:serine phosphatase RsbU (regulator of sigma subunit)
MEANIILNELRLKVKNSLNQRGKMNETQDGMDMALCVIDIENYTLQYAGAYNPLYLIRNGELIHFKADRMPIGIYSREKDSFSKYEDKLLPGDALYMFSDGYVDQLDETGENKFMSKPFKRLLLSIQDKEFSQQKEILENTLKEWQGNAEQIDDILVMGLKIS